MCSVKVYCFGMNFMEVKKFKPYLWRNKISVVVLGLGCNCKLIMLNHYLYMNLANEMHNLNVGVECICYEDCTITMWLYTFFLYYYVSIFHLCLVEPEEDWVGIVRQMKFAKMTKGKYPNVSCKDAPMPPRYPVPECCCRKPCYITESMHPATGGRAYYVCSNDRVSIFLAHNRGVVNLYL